MHRHQVGGRRLGRPFGRALRALPLLVTVTAVTLAACGRAGASPAQPGSQQDGGETNRAAAGRVEGDKESLPLVRASNAHSRGFTGAGTSIAVLDTGVDFRRSTFGPCTAAGAPQKTCRVAFTADVGSNDNTLDDNGHGTNVAAIALSMAPEARIIVLDVFEGAQTSSSRVLTALDWVIKNRKTYNIVAVNMSLGATSYNTKACTRSPYAAVFRDLRATGILPVVSAGNSGYQNGRFVDGVADPACVPGAVSVGAVYDSGQGARQYPRVCADRQTKADQVTCWSQTGPTLSLYAPGSRISAAGITQEGTSQAAPHVAGAAAALSSKCKKASVDQIEKALTTAGPKITDPRNGITRVRLDLDAAAKSLQDSGVCR